MEKPEALFLADELEAPLGTVIGAELYRRAAKELRRLHAQRDALLEALKEAAEALEIAADNGGVNFYKYAKEARAAMAQPAPEPETCTWHQDGDSDSGVYAASCGRYFNLEDGTPEDNKMQWCCYCGKKLVQELIAEVGDD